MAKVLSCGVIVRRKAGELLLGRATGRNYWDIPKGVRDDGETSIDAARRELREETGLEVDAEQLLDLGVHAYLKAKDLQLFLLEPPDRDIELASCSCTTFFRSRAGRPIPEVDAYCWVERADVPRYCGKNMARVLLTLEW